MDRAQNSRRPEKVMMHHRFLCWGLGTVVRKVVKNDMYGIRRVRDSSETEAVAS